MIRVSVIMGAYNPESLEMLSSAIDSILEQTYTCWEFIICDDGSTNGIIELAIDKYKDFKQIKFINNMSNRGLHYSLNRCIEHSEGEYIVRQDADDISIRTRLEELVKFMDNEVNYDFASSSIMAFSESKSWVIKNRVKAPEKKDLLFGSPHVHAASIFRKAVFSKVNGYRVSWETSRCEDYDLFMRLYSKGFKGYNLEAVLYHVRFDNNAIKRRKYINRIKEATVRYKGFRELKAPKWSLLYVMKPLIVGLIPFKLLLIIKGKKSLGE